VRHRWASKQCVWLGSRRHLCRCERRIANAYSNGDGYGNGNIHGYSNAHGYGDGDGHSYRYSYSNAPTHVYAEICADTEASSHTAAQTVTVFAKANIVAIGDSW
jgi:hypothetical protein